MQKRVFGHMRTYYGLHYQLTESLDTVECMNGEQRPGQRPVYTSRLCESAHFAYVRRDVLS